MCSPLSILAPVPDVEFFIKPHWIFCKKTSLLCTKFWYWNSSVKGSLKLRSLLTRERWHDNRSWAFKWKKIGLLSWFLQIHMCTHTNGTSLRISYKIELLCICYNNNHCHVSNRQNILKRMFLKYRAVNCLSIVSMWLQEMHL